MDNTKLDRRFGEYSLDSFRETFLAHPFGLQHPFRQCIFELTEQSRIAEHGLRIRWVHPFKRLIQGGLVYPDRIRSLMGA